MEGAQRRLAALLLLPVGAQLQQHQLAGGVDHVARIEGAAFGLAPRVRLLEVGLVLEEPHALLHRPVVGVQLDADDEAGEPHQRLGELAELDAGDRAGRSPPRSSSARRSGPSPRCTTSARAASSGAPSTPPCAGAGSGGSGRGTPRASRCSTASGRFRSRRCSTLALLGPASAARRSGSRWRAAGVVSNGPGIHRLADDQRRNPGLGATCTSSPSGTSTTPLRARNVLQLGHLLARGGDQRAGGGVRVLGRAPRFHRVAAVEPSGQRAERLLRRASSRSAMSSSRSHE